MTHHGKWAVVLTTVLLGGLVLAFATAGTCDDQKPGLHERLDNIEKELADIKDQLNQPGANNADLAKRVDELEKTVTDLKAQAGGKATAPAKPSWVDKLKVSGYGQIRFEDGNNDPDVGSQTVPTKDTSFSKFTLRRIRPRIEGQVNERAGFAVELDATEGGVVLTDAFGFYKLDHDGDFTLYTGQRNVPFGLDTPRSDSNRPTFEKIEILRRMIPNDRDLGAWVQYSPTEKKDLFNTMKSKFGTEGDYGMFTVGVFNGQGRDTAEANINKTVSARFAYPFMIGDRYAEVGASMFNGMFTTSTKEFPDKLHGLHAILPPQPFGVEGEWYTGETCGSDVNGWAAQGSFKDNNNDTFYVRRDIMNGYEKASTPTLNNFRRWTYGVCRELDTNVRLALEYDNGQRETTVGGPYLADKLWGAQMQYKF